MCVGFFIRGRYLLRYEGGRWTGLFVILPEFDLIGSGWGVGEGNDCKTRFDAIVQ